jgi:hypothetical protein
VWGEAKVKSYAGMRIAGDAEIVMCTGIKVHGNCLEYAVFGLISGYVIPICPDIHCFSGNKKPLRLLAWCLLRLIS